MNAPESLADGRANDANTFVKGRTANAHWHLRVGDYADGVTACGKRPTNKYIGWPYENTGPMQPNDVKCPRCRAAAFEGK